MSDINNLKDIYPALTDSMAVKLKSYEDLLIQYNSKLNLISKSSLPYLRTLHFADCLQALEILKPDILSEETLFDFGSGNGLPGIVASILFPDQKIVLIERDLRKAEFLKIVLSELKLTNVNVLDKDLSQISDDATFNIISRAMAPLPKFLLESRKKVRVGGTAYLFKGEHWSTELSSVPAQVFEFWDVELYKNYFLPDIHGERYLIRCHRI